MALRVWLPLNGNLENKGLSGLSRGEGTLTYGDGKIGKALYMETASTANGIYVPKQEKQVFTIALWFKAPGYTGTRRDLCNEGRDYNTYGWWAGLEANSNTLTIVAASSGGYTQSFIPDTWYHIAFSRDESKNVYIYINGVLVSTRTGTGDLNYSESNGYINIGRFCYGSSNSKLYPYQGYLNDFRYYDECLSPKQIKEISKGLLLHYKLEGIGANPNLLKGTNLGTNGWSWNVGSRYGKSMAEVEWKGVKACKFGITNGDESSTSNWRVLEFRTQSYSNIVLKPSTIYTISFDTDRKVIGSCSFRAGNAQHTLGDASSMPYATLPDGTYHYTISITTVASDSENWTYDDQCLYMQYWVNIDDFGIVANLKIEEGTTETKWIPHIDDVSYSTLGYGMTIGRDSSGHGYHGATSGVLAFNSDTGRYEGSTRFTTNAAYIKLPVLTTTGFANSFTIIYWVKIADMSGKMAWGFEDGNRLNIYPTGSVICCNTGDSANNPYQNNGTSIDFSQWNDNKWHQFAMTGDGTSNKLYVDGELRGIAKTYKGITGTQMYISGWQSSSTNYRWNNGSISDFRMYATALSADDIKQLYQTSALVDKGQSFYTYEFKEV